MATNEELERARPASVDDVTGAADPDHLRSLRPLAGLDRRGFLVTSLASGFAASVSPAQATTITTDAQGLLAGEVRIPVEGGDMPAYRAMPQPGPGRRMTQLATVLVVQEIFGVHEHIKDVCRRFAKLGYLAIAPELFARQGNPAMITDMQVLMRDVVAKVPDAQVMKDLDATLAWADRSGSDRQRIGVTGFCWGGRITWLYAAHSARVKAGVAWYGRLIPAPPGTTNPMAQLNPLQPLQPIERVGELKAPVLGLYGGKDGGIPVESVEQMRAALKGPKASVAAKASEIVLYPDAQHGFYADYRASYKKDDAEAAFARLRDWFAKHGVAA